jgi:hypothetical protein
MGGSPEEQEAAMTQWMNWFGGLGEAVVVAGSPFGPAATIASDGAVGEGGHSSLSKYSIISADSLEDTVGKAKGCPVLTSGGSVDVYEAMPIG